jgi:membrane associated rhomboid family serine protease
MRRAPKWTEFPRYPVVAWTAVMAIVITVAWWAHKDIWLLLPSAEIRRGQLWRLLTDCFPHVTVLHLVFNIYWLWVFGTFVEEVYGHLRTAALLALLAVSSSAWDFALSQGGVGLSGIGYGLFGLLWVLSRHDDSFRETVDRRTVVLFIGWFVFCLATTWSGTLAIANVAHASGLIVGVLAGLAIALPNRRTLLTGAIAALFLFGIWGATLGRPIVNLSGTAGYAEGKWGYEMLQANRNKEAARWLRDAVEFQPKLAGNWFNLGIAYERLGDKTSALDAYKRAHELDPNETEFADAAKD